MATSMKHFLAIPLACLSVVALASVACGQDATSVSAPITASATDAPAVEVEAIDSDGQPVVEEKPLTSEEKTRLRLEKKRLSRIHKTRTPVEGFEAIDMFRGMESGEVEVIIKARSAADSNIIVTNNTDRHLAIEMPATFSAVPAMRQQFGGGGGFGGGQGGGLGGGQGGIGGQQQGIGGGLGGGQGGGGLGGGGLGGGGLGGGGGGGVFNIPPGDVGKLAVKTVCLEYGKKEPKSYINYKVQPLANLNSDPAIEQMCRMLAEGEVSQSAAQAAAWRVTDNVSWQELATKNRFESRMSQTYQRYFNRNDLMAAQLIIAEANKRAQLAKPAVESKGDEDGSETYSN